MSQPTGPAGAPSDDTSGGERLLSELTDDLLRRHRAGECPSVEEYIEKYPGLAGRILELFPVMLAMEHRAAGTALVPAAFTERVGATIGRYKLLERIGEGGFGVVYMAEQLTPVRRKVALKVIKPGVDTRQVIARFEAERQALALMDHENIAKVLDGGATDSGRPYFVMELVRGVPITEYCDKNELPPRQRLELFIQVCCAVQHAHIKGIIHRDIKPTNVLVTRHDGVAVPKVIDFGVAKATGQQLTEKTLFTNFAQMVGTPLYMSPEQAEMTGVDVDTRSDIYSLGVVLYELLTGTTPLDNERLKRSAFDEVRRIIREEEPPRPSTRLSTLGEKLRTISARRKCDPARLGRIVRGELDWIVMRALEKERSRRYETAKGLAADVQHYLNGEAVQAHPPSQWYRVRKFVRPHRGLLMAAGLILLTLLGGVAGTTCGLLRAEHQWQLAEAKKREAVGERDAKDAALKAEQHARAGEIKARQQAFAALRTMTADVVERKFSQGAALTEDDRDFLRGVIAQYDAFATIQGEDADSRAVRAEGRWRVANMRHPLGELKEAENDYNQALIVQKRLAADFPASAEFRRDLVLIHNNRGILLRDTGRLPEAEKEYDQALEIQRQLAADFPSRPEFRHMLAKIQGNRGNLLRQTGRVAEAQQQYDRALEIQKQLAVDFPARPQFRQELASSYNLRGNLLKNSGSPHKAENDYEQAISIQKQLAADFPSRPEFRQELARSHNDRGNQLATTGRLPEAEKDLDQALILYQQLAAEFPTRPEFRQELAESYINRAGLVLRPTGRLTEAEQDLDQALSIQKQFVAEFPSRPEFRRELAGSYGHRGILLVATGRLAEAQQEYEQGLSIMRKLAADFPNQPDVRNELAGTCVNFAILRQHQGDWAAAKELLLEGRPHHLAALNANSRHPMYRQFYRNHLNVLTSAYAGLLEREDAVRTAQTCRDLGWDPPADAYDAACSLGRCIPIVARHDKLDDQQRKDAVQFYSEAAVKLLDEAVGRGYKDAMRLTKDTDLNPLRQREDFQKLVAELEGKAK